MNIACIIHSLDGGGAERVMASLCSRLSRRGHHVTLVTLDDGRIKRHQVDPEVNCRHLNVMSDSHGLTSRFVHTVKRIRAVRAAVASVDPDVILSFCDRTNILTLLACGGPLRPVRAGIVVSERSDPTQQQLGRFWEAMRNRTYRRATAIVALTEPAANSLRHRFPVKVTVIPSAVDAPPCESDRQAAAARRLIVGVGRLEPEKGFDRLIEAFSRLGDQTREWSLTIFGEGSQRTNLERQIKQLNLESKVTLPGWKSPIWPLLAQATIFAMPSRYEGFPSALLEAMALGIPTVAVDCESGPRAIIDSAMIDSAIIDSASPSNSGTIGRLVSNDIEGLVTGLNELISCPENREKMGAAGKIVVERFGWDALVDAYEKVLSASGNAAGS